MLRVAVRARIAFASGVAGAIGAALMLSGRAPGSVIVAAALCVVARAAAVVSSEQPSAARALARLAATSPAWVALAIAAALRAGSPGLADVRGAHAVLGLGVLHGSPASVVGLLMVSAAVAVAIGATWARLEDPQVRLAALGVGLQAWLVATIVAGPQVVGAADVVPWIGALLFAGAGAGLGARAAASEWTPKLVNAAAGVGLVLVLAGGRA